MSEPLYCPVRRHYCRCHDWGDRCDVFDDERELMSNYHDFADSLRAIAPGVADYCDNLEREMMLEKALDSCKQYGVPIEHLKTLARETGAVAWALRNSMTGEKSGDVLGRQDAAAPREGSIPSAGLNSKEKA